MVYNGPKKKYQYMKKVDTSSRIIYSCFHHMLFGSKTGDVF